MGNPLFNILGGQSMPSPLGNMAGMLQQFKQFCASFQGDPKQKVQELLNSGQMSQQQFNELQGMAQMFQQMMGKN